MTRIYSIALAEALKAGNGRSYSDQVAQEIAAMVQQYLADSAASQDSDLAEKTVRTWIEGFRGRVNRKEMSASWGANFLALLIKTICIEATLAPELSQLCAVFKTVYQTDNKKAHWFPQA